MASAPGYILARIRPYLFSRLTLFIIGVNLVSMLILVCGIFVITENRRGLVNAKFDSLEAQAGTIADVLIGSAVVTDPVPYMDPEDARYTLVNLTNLNKPDTRILIYTPDVQLAADSRLISGQIRVEELPPAGLTEQRFDPLGWVGDLIRAIALTPEEKAAQERTALDDARIAIEEGRVVRGVRRSPDGERIVSVTIPISPIQAIVGAVTYESYDLDELINEERRALTPFILFAALASGLSAVGLTVYIAVPTRRLAQAARDVRLAGGRRVPLPDMSRRKDELGSLGQAFAAMTNALYDRLDAIENFAADVSHEIKNPLTSIRSAAEVLPKARDDDRRDRLIKVIQHDVRRLDRLITDISNASRLDAELAREDLKTVDIAELASDLAQTYDSERLGKRGVRLEVSSGDGAMMADIHEGPVSRVILNMIDNALTFSPENGVVSIRLQRTHAHRSRRQVIRVTVEDEGPGIPEDNLERIFERFYTRRPEGADFGDHSGLGLSISRQIAQAHDGSLRAENMTSPDGTIKGARFIFELPANR